MKPRILDLFCGAGGAAMGYANVGFEVVGVDIAAQPRFPFDFVQADALDFLWALLDRESGELDEYDAIHASPPCQAYSALRVMSNRNSKDGVEYPDLVAPTRELLSMTGLPFVIENVPNAPLIDPVVICGTSAGCPVVQCLDGPRQVYRHRLFETNWELLVPPCNHTVPALGTYGNGGRWKRTYADGGYRRGGYQGSREECFEGMGIDWMTRAEVGQAIPPCYTEIIGEQLLARIEAAEEVGRVTS